jgi:predicted N-acetyltransferase YhbS
MGDALAEIVVRDEQPQHALAIHNVHCAAFAGDAEARLVDLLRDVGALRISLVAALDGAVIGQSRSRR